MFALCEPAFRMVTPVEGLPDRLAKLKIDIPGKGNKPYVSAPGGRISVVDIDSGSCSVELDQNNSEDVIKINEDCKVSGLNTQKQHAILIDMVTDRMGSS